ncbi:hypothetical protein IFR04_003535 [Cadophora malorum]|uniref:Uncharacterized protein n=1 Tax=Cadophora malorum TaxID=108018 RepID=A0A8H7WEG0_9HELO|nr:hypothetical protein IFR04_003535 [Cadophora malorum]
MASQSADEPADAQSQETIDPAMPSPRTMPSPTFTYSGSLLGRLELVGQTEAVVELPSILTPLQKKDPGIPNTIRMSPVTVATSSFVERYLHLGPPKSLYLEFTRSSPLKKVRNWKLIFSQAAGKYRPPVAIRDFARLVVDSPPLASFTVSAMSYNMFDTWRDRQCSCHRYHISTHLAPIRMLRNVDRLQFEDPGRTISSKLQSELKLVIQSTLELAKFASDETDFETFIDQRKIIVEFLEPQYQRIAAANDLWTSFVKEHKTENEMDRQYLQIQQLRKRLFFWDKDDADHGCELDIRHGDSTRQLCADILGVAASRVAIVQLAGAEVNATKLLTTLWKDVKDAPRQIRNVLN